MKKTFIMTAILLSFAAATFAASGETYIDDFGSTGLTLYGDSSATPGTNKTAIGKTSTGVAVAWQTSANGYALMTQHKSGTKAYGSSYDSTAIYQTLGSVNPGTPAFGEGALTKSDTTDFANTTKWDAM